MSSPYGVSNFQPMQQYLPMSYGSMGGGMQSMQPQYMYGGFAGTQPTQQGGSPFVLVNNFANGGVQSQSAQPQSMIYRMPPGGGCFPSRRPNGGGQYDNSGGDQNQNMMGMAMQTINMMMSILTQLMGNMGGGGITQPQQPSNCFPQQQQGWPPNGYPQQGGYPGGNVYYANNGAYDTSGNGNTINYGNWGGQLPNGGYGNISFDGTNNGGINIGINYWNGLPPQQQTQPDQGPGNCPPTPPTCPPPPPPVVPPSYDGGTNGQYWGDPHLVGFDGEKYDVQGAAGKTYNMISDQNFQYNTKFESFGTSGANVVSQAGIKVGNDQIYYDRTIAAPTFNGTAMQTGKAIKLDDGGNALWDGTTLKVNTKEYNVDIKKTLNATNGNYLDSNITINNGGPYQDFVSPHGLLGQTADGIKGAKNSGKDQGKQGGTVIDGTVADYEVSNIWDNNDKYNRFGVEIGKKITDSHGTVVKVLDKNGNVIYQKPTQPIARTTASVTGTTA